MKTSPFHVALADIVAVHGSRRQVDISTEIDWQLETVDIGPALEADLLVENASGTVVVRGTTQTDLGLTCHRCLTAWVEPLSVGFAEALGVEGDEDGYPFQSDHVDVEQMLRDALLLNIPLRPLCRDDCLGLCATCGADLNTGACPGHDDEAATPFGALRDLLEP